MYCSVASCLLPAIFIEYVGDLSAPNEQGLGQLKGGTATGLGLAGGGPSGSNPSTAQGILNTRDRNAIANSIPTPIVGKVEVEAITSKMEVMFKLNPPPKKTLNDGRTLHAQEEGEEDDEEQEEGDGEGGGDEEEKGAHVASRPVQVSSESKDNDEDDDDDAPIDYTSAPPPSSSQSNPTAPSQTAQSNPTAPSQNSQSNPPEHVLFRLDPEGDSGGVDDAVDQEIDHVDPSTVFDKESLDDITTFFINTAGSMEGKLSYARMRKWDDIKAVFENGLMNEESLQRVWREVSRGAATINYDEFVRLNVRMERMMDEVEAAQAQALRSQGSSTRSIPLSPRERRGKLPSTNPSIDSLTSLSQPHSRSRRQSQSQSQLQSQSQSQLQSQSQSQAAVRSSLPSSQIDLTDGQLGLGVGGSSSGATRLDTLQPQMATEEQKQHKA